MATAQLEPKLAEPEVARPLLVVGPRHVTPKPGFEHMMSREASLMAMAIFGTSGEFDSSVGAIVSSFKKTHRIAEPAKVEAITRAEMPAGKDKAAYAALAQSLAQEKLAGLPYRWNVINWDTPAYAFPALVVWVPPLEKCRKCGALKAVDEDVCTRCGDAKWGQVFFSIGIGLVFLLGGLALAVKTGGLGRIVGVVLTAFSLLCLWAVTSDTREKIRKGKDRAGGV